MAYQDVVTGTVDVRHNDSVFIAVTVNGKRRTLRISSTGSVDVCTREDGTVAYQKHPRTVGVRLLAAFSALVTEGRADA